MLRIATFNVNGIRAAQRRGVDAWLDQARPDILAVQEMRAPVDAVPERIFGDHHLTYHAGELPGRNGVALASRVPPSAVRHGFGHRASDAHGRYLEADYDLGDFGLTVGSVYVPKGATWAGPGADPEKYRRKMAFLTSFRAYLTRARRDAARAGREFLVMGDFNIAHTTADLKAWKTNQRSEGFLPQEREWFSSILGPRTLVDVVRRLHPGTEGPYSWWSWRGQAFANDAGWRIDYHLASAALADRAVVGGTHRAPSYDARISDHAPVVVDYDV